MITTVIIIQLYEEYQIKRKGNIDMTKKSTTFIEMIQEEKLIYKVDSYSVKCHMDPLQFVVFDWFIFYSLEGNKEKRKREDNENR